MASPRVSVLCVTNRPGALPILRDNLQKQTFKDFELVIVEAATNLTDIDWPFDCSHALENPAKNPQLTSVPFNLGQAYNQGIRDCRGEYIFCLQDYIWIPANAIAKFVERADADPERKTVVIGVGHKAKYPDSLEGDFSKKPTGISEVDDRLVGEGRDVYWSNYSQFELNYALAPKQMFYDAGGLEESFDNTYYGADNTALALKAEMVGYKFLIDKSNECIGYNQALFPRPKDWEERHNNKGNYNAWARKVASGVWTRFL